MKFGPDPRRRWAAARPTAPAALGEWRGALGDRPSLRSCQGSRPALAIMFAPVQPNFFARPERAHRMTPSSLS